MFTINDLIWTCIDIGPNAEWMIYDSENDFDLDSPNWVGYNGYRAIPAYVKSREVAKVQFLNNFKTVAVAIR